MSGKPSLHLTSTRQQRPGDRGLRGEFYSRLAPGPVLVDLFEHPSGVHFFLKDDHGRTIVFNSLLRSRLGLPRDEDVIGLTDYDLFLFGEGSHHRLYEKLGAHVLRGAAAVHFGVWAPNAAEVAVVGDFNGWDGSRHPLRPRHDGSGIWEALVEGAEPGQRYKYRVVSRHRGYRADKSDPFAFASELPPPCASCPPAFPPAVRSDAEPSSVSFGAS